MGKFCKALGPTSGSEESLAVTPFDARSIPKPPLAKIEFPEIERVYIAGAFGRCIRMENFARLGVFPRKLLDRVALVGNSSKSGAALCLLSKGKREEAVLIARKIKFVELSCYPDYDKLFARCLAFREELGS